MLVRLGVNTCVVPDNATEGTAAVEEGGVHSPPMMALPDVASSASPPPTEPVCGIGGMYVCVECVI